MTGGALEILKWLALVLMTGDHIDAAVYGRSVEWLYDLGRIAMPIFAAVFARNLARPGIKPRLRQIRNKLLLVGAIAYPFHVIALGQGWDVLNILFAFAVAVQYIIAQRSGDAVNKLLGAALVLASGFFIEFHWFGILLTIAWWYYFISDGRNWSWFWLVAAFVGVCVENGNAWAFVALPLAWAGLTFTWPDVPRVRNLFWRYYPAHLAVLAGIAWYLDPSVFDAFEPSALNAAFAIP